MSRPTRFNIDPVTRICSGAVGQPGKRTFYLDVSNNDFAVRMWVEKEVLNILSEAIDKALADVGRGVSPEDAPPIGPSSFDGEFRSGQVGMAQDTEHRMIVLTFTDAEAGQRAPYRLRCAASYEKMSGLSRQMKAVYESGRPACPLCGGPMDPEGHVCPRSNGHRRLE